MILLAIYGHAGAQSYMPMRDCGSHEGGIVVMTKDFGEKYLIAGDDKGYIYFHDLNTCELVKKFHAHGAAVSRLQFNSTGNLLISATQDGEIKIFDFSKDKIIQAIFSPDYSGINFVLFSIADGFVYFNGNRKLFKTRSDLSQKINEVFNETDTITDAVITNDRSALIYATGNRLKVLNTRTDIVHQTFTAGSSVIRKLSLISDTLLASWSDDGTIYFWHYLLGQINPAPLFFLKAGNPASHSFSNDGKLMCSGNIGTWARIWKPMERNIEQELFAHSKTVTSSVFGKDEVFFTGGLDGKIFLWAKDSVRTLTATPPLQTQKEEIAKPVQVDSAVGVEMTAANIPKFIYGREVISTMQIEMKQPVVTVYVFDNSYIDGDTMSLFFNGQWVLDHYGVTRKKKELQLNLVPNTNNYLVLFANNLGKSPPNTAAIEFNDGEKTHFFRLSSDLRKCSAVNFYYKN